MKETFKQYIFRLMEEKGYVLDQDIYNFRKKEGNYYQAEVYKNLYRKLKHFEDYKFTQWEHCGRKYLARTEDMPENQWLQIPKELYLKLSA
jgi:hypothetical protein